LLDFTFRKSAGAARDSTASEEVPWQLLLYSNLRSKLMAPCALVFLRALLITPKRSRKLWPVFLNGSAALDAGVALSENLTGQVFVNQSAAFSDFHGTGANPSANATYTDGAYVASRFRFIQSRRHI